MTRPFDTDGGIERIIKDKRQQMVADKRAALVKERDHTTEINKNLKRDDRRPVPDVDLEMGLFETDLDRRLKLLDQLSKKNCKLFKEDASKYNEATDFETLTAQSVEAALYGVTIYFSVILGRNTEAVV